MYRAQQRSSVATETISQTPLASDMVVRTRSHSRSARRRSPSVGDPRRHPPRRLPWHRRPPTRPVGRRAHPRPG
ncbi:hypothetical protein FRAAL6614 [Frankia alni ACN14a]|uniref:Uncharacterized protein n=1 Tax=Frankia alni (strain DSM 45986 / CECT 9034 / ACN14a) TaxID=326424 RepID=Q0RBE9_FRAAA|nr:hypothetical protein FRAAL6614 [Frankia alni ACN14a]